MTNEKKIIEQDLESTPETIAALRQTDWYKLLKDDIHSDFVETEFDVRNQIIELYHGVGQRIAENTDNFKREKVYGKHIAETIGEDINRHPSVVRRAMQFYEKAPDLQKFLSDKPKNISWTKIKREYLPEIKKTVATNDLQQEESSSAQQGSEESVLVIDVDLEATTFSLLNLLDLFLEIINAVPLVDRHIIPQQFANLLKDKFSADYINILINKYSKNKTKEKIVFLKELELASVPASLVGTPSLFGEPQVIPQSENKTVSTSKQTPIALLVFHYKQLYRKKYNQEPPISDASWAKWGKRLKLKLSEGYTIDDVISLLHIFAKSKDSENLSFDPGVFLSDFVFSKMIQLKNKGNSVVLEGKYGKF